MPPQDRLAVKDTNLDPMSMKVKMRHRLSKEINKLVRCMNMRKGDLEQPDPEQNGS